MSNTMMTVLAVRIMLYITRKVCPYVAYNLSCSIATSQLEIRASVDYMPKHNDSQFSIAITVTVKLYSSRPKCGKAKIYGQIQWFNSHTKFILFLL